jgi:hypothetical protein
VRVSVVRPNEGRRGLEGLRAMGVFSGVFGVPGSFISATVTRTSIGPGDEMPVTRNGIGSGLAGG